MQEKTAPSDSSTFLGNQFKDVSAFSSALFKNLITATSVSNELDEDDVSLYTSLGSSHPVYNRIADSQRRISKLMLSLIPSESKQHHQDVCSVLSQIASSDNATAIKQSENLVETCFDKFVDISDTVFDHIDRNLDDIRGSSKIAIKLNPRHFPDKKISQQSSARSESRLRPQIAFEDKIDNSNSPFVPILKTKPNSIVPLKDSIKLITAPTSSSEVDTSQLSADLTQHLQSVGMKTSSNVSTVHGLPLSHPEYSHPYEHEILRMDYLPSQLTKREVQMYKPLADTRITFIDTPSQLLSLVETLHQQTEFAVDLEHHSERSFQGFVCLMQISTRAEDFLVDTLKLRAHLHVLLPVFTNPRIVKVFHGADSDVVWLQRDFGLYIVNLFDTGQAARVLSKKRFGLAHLLQEYCDLFVDKKYQLADWRQRPLPEEMAKYAREDTHYLLYIYDRMINELWKNGNSSSKLLTTVLNRSKAVALKKYEKDLLTCNSHVLLYNKFNLYYTPKQQNLYEKLFFWRDSTARTNDESVQYVLPDKLLFSICDKMPTSVPVLLKLCSSERYFNNNPLTYVRMHASSIVGMIENSVMSTGSQRSAIASSPIHMKSHISSPNQSNEFASNISFVEQKYDIADCPVQLSAELRARKQTLVKLHSSNIDCSVSRHCRLSFDKSHIDRHSALVTSVRQSFTPALLQRYGIGMKTSSQLSIREKEILSPTVAARTAQNTVATSPSERSTIEPPSKKLKTTQTASDTTDTRVNPTSTSSTKVQSLASMYNIQKLKKIKSKSKSKAISPKLKVGSAEEKKTQMMPYSNVEVDSSLQRHKKKVKQ